MSIYQLAEAAYDRRILTDSMKLGYHSVVEATLTLVDLLRIEMQWPASQWRLRDWPHDSGSAKVHIQPSPSGKELDATGKVTVEYTFDGKKWLDMTFTVKRDARPDGEWWQIGEDYADAVHFGDSASLTAFYKSVSEDVISGARNHDPDSVA